MEYTLVSKANNTGELKGALDEVFRTLHDYGYDLIIRSTVYDVFPDDLWGVLGSPTNAIPEYYASYHAKGVVLYNFKYFETVDRMWARVHGLAVLTDDLVLATQLKLMYF